ncbi:MAG: penicillin-binding protein 2 [Actinobacteria bacterium]|nr:penicillin-binding protein 2 [Actinomycetota bacterium]
MSAPRSREKIVYHRLIIIFSFIFLCFSGITARLIYIQVIRSEEFNKQALRQRLRKIKLTPKRGIIYDRNKNVLAMSIEVDSVYATPRFVKDPDNTAEKLSLILGMDKSIIKQKLTRKSGFVYIARKIDKDKSKKIKKLKLKGIGYLRESKRYYPGSNLAPQLIGFAGMDNKGLTGLELYYDALLQGESGELVTEIDPLGRSIPDGVLNLSPSIDGDNVVLTIDKNIQFVAESELKKAVESSKAKAGVVIVMDTKTGEILAMANMPSFDSNVYNQAEVETLRNRAVTDVYEPGSTMKIVIAASALEEKIVRPQDVFYLPSTIKVADKEIKEAHERPPGNFTFSQIVSKSSNVGAVTIGLKLGKERIFRYIKSFGLMEKTGIDYPGEVKGYLPPLYRWYGSTIGNIPIGQGISVTALQMLRAVAVIGNDGVIVKPYLLKDVLKNETADSNGKSKSIKPVSRRVVSHETSQQLKNILKEVVAEGTGGNARVSGYEVAGKTGTAQKPKSNGKGYEKGKYIASFVGFVPADNPKLAVIVIIDEPQGVIWGGSIAAPVFSNVSEYSLRRLKVLPAVVN